MLLFQTWSFLQYISLAESEQEGVEVRIVQTVNGRIPTEEIRNHMDARTAVSLSWVIAANGSVTDIGAIKHLQER